MKHTLRFVSLLALLLLAASPAWAQPGGSVAPAGFLSNTTLSGSITDTATTLVVASAAASTGSTFGAPAANQCLYIGRELMTITAISSTTFTVRRGTVNRASHLNAAIIHTGPCNQFKVTDPTNVAGYQDCTLYVLPWINARTGDTWWCDLQVRGVGVAATSGGQWSYTNLTMRNGTAGSRRLAQ